MNPSSQAAGRGKVVRFEMYLIQSRNSWRNWNFKSRVCLVKSVTCSVVFYPVVSDLINDDYFFHVFDITGWHVGDFDPPIHYLTHQFWDVSDILLSYFQSFTFVWSYLCPSPWTRDKKLSLNLDLLNPLLYSILEQKLGSYQHCYCYTIHALLYFSPIIKL